MFHTVPYTDKIKLKKAHKIRIIPTKKLGIEKRAKITSTPKLSRNYDVKQCFLFEYESSLLGMIERSTLGLARDSDVGLYTT